MKIHALVLGAGVASNAYITLLDYNKSIVSVIGSPFDNKKIDSMKKKNRKSSYYAAYSKNINFFRDSEINLVNKKSINLIIVGTNTKGLQWVIKSLNLLKINCPVLLITKGLAQLNKRLVTISDLFLEKCFNQKIIMSAGPCLAKELINKAHTRTLFASKNISYAKYVKKILENEYYHPEISNDIHGAEICAAIKNIYATVIGSAIGQVGELAINKENNYYNSSSGLFEQSLKEMAIITKKFKGNINTVLGLAGAGDLYVSVLGGRNAKLGSYLGKGVFYKSIINRYMKGITVEGAEVTKLYGQKILNFVGKGKLPLLRSLLIAIKKNSKLVIDWKQFTI